MESKNISSATFEVIKSNSRGHFNHGWLKTYHSFSFANYFDPARIHFGALRVINDDVIAPGRGFGLHPHDNMEIITIPLFGALMHEDSMGHQEVIRPNEVQVMSAGTGIFHSEFNASNSEEVGLFQIWIMPHQKNVVPSYNQISFETCNAQNQWQTMVGPVDSGLPLTIHQNAWVSRSFIAAGETLNYTSNVRENGNYLMVAEGTVQVLGEQLERRDAISMSVSDFAVKALTDAYVINLEVPMYY